MWLEFNPWWKDEKWEEKDKHIREWKAQEIKWLPEWLKQISLEPFSLNFVIGPRQVGKTTGIKLLIKQLIESGTEAERITYLSCEPFIDAHHLRKMLEKYFEMREKEDILVLDEVTSIENWWKVVKGFIDLGKFENSVVIVSGSISMKLKKHAELFPGRKGKGKKVYVLPLSFPEYLRVKNIPFKKKYEEIIRKSFEEYAAFGGFPAAVNRRAEFFSDFLDGLESDLSKIDKSYKLAMQILSQIITKAPSALSYSAVGSEIQISHITVREYLEALEELFVTKAACRKEGKNVLFRKEKKIFIRDPGIVRAVASVFNLEVRKDFLYEWIVQEHLLRKFGEIYYYRNRYEIDCIAGDLKIEVKAGKPHRKYPRNVKVLDEEEIPRFLIELFASE